MCNCIKYVLNWLGLNNKENSMYQTERECVICLEKNNSLQHIDKYIYNRECNCEYYVHKNCLYQWYSVHYPENTAEINCLICNSRGNIFTNDFKQNDIGFFEMAMLFLYYSTK